MKKTYFEPEVEVLEFELTQFLCESTGAEGGNDDGGLSTGETDPTESGWGSDY